jgi:hypothetical protein
MTDDEMRAVLETLGCEFRWVDEHKGLSWPHWECRLGGMVITSDGFCNDDESLGYLVRHAYRRLGL